MDLSAGGSLDAAVVVRVVHLEPVERNVDFFIGEFVALLETVVSEEVRSALMHMPDGARGVVVRRRIQVEARLVDDGGKETRYRILGPGTSDGPSSTPARSAQSPSHWPRG